MNETREKSWIVVAVVGLLWLGIGVGDWYMRFHWFSWQQNFRIRAASTTDGPAAPMKIIPKPDRRGGDLTELVGIPALREHYAEARAATTNFTDEFGFFNKPPTENVYYPIVVVGDSFMATGARMEDTFPGRLAAISGLPVYNHAFVGRGSFWGIVRFLMSDRFVAREPKVLVWGIIEREISGAYFSGISAQLEYLRQHAHDTTVESRFNIEMLRPARLHQNLPDTSMLAQISSRLWSLIRYKVFGQVNPYIVTPRGDIEGKPFLMYFPSIDAMRWSHKVRDPDLVANIIAYHEKLCREKGIKLVIVLIPDKEQVYRELVPPKYQPIPDSALNALAASLTKQGIACVNVLDAFRDESRRDVMLYWRDDTHWNTRGIDLAAHETWSAISNLVEER